MIVGEEHSGMRLDAYLASLNAYPSRSVAARYCDEGKVQVNGSPKSKNYKLAQGEEVT